MQEVFGNLWDFNGIHAITTNGFVKRNGCAVMGRGCAREAAKRFSNLPLELAGKIIRNGNHVFYFPEYGIMTFPVKHNWWEVADLDLIKQSAEELLILVQFEGIDRPVYLPRPGCGNGKLDWSVVKPVITEILTPDQFNIVAFPSQGGIPSRLSTLTTRENSNSKASISTPGSPPSDESLSTARRLAAKPRAF